VRLEPGNSIVGGGVWHPEPGALARIRQAIADDPRAWKKIKDSPPLIRSSRT